MVKLTDKQLLDWLGRTKEAVGGWQVTRYGHTGGYQLIPHGREVFQRFSEQITPRGKTLRLAIKEAMQLAGDLEDIKA